MPGQHVVPAQAESFVRSQPGKLSYQQLSEKLVQSSDLDRPVTDGHGQLHLADCRMSQMKIDKDIQDILSSACLQFLARGPVLAQPHPTASGRLSSPSSKAARPPGGPEHLQSSVQDMSCRLPGI